MTMPRAFIPTLTPSDWPWFQTKRRNRRPAVQLQARRRARASIWLRLAKALVANVKLAGVDDATDQLLFSALRTAERAAESRARGLLQAPGACGSWPSQKRSPKATAGTLLPP